MVSLLDLKFVRFMTDSPLQVALTAMWSMKAMSLCWDTDCTIRLYQEAVMISISLSSIWMVGTRLQGYRLSVGHRTERAKLVVGIQTDRALVLSPYPLEQYSSTSRIELLIW
jgi:hypothetical protein